jgi:hypothetical protein
MCKFDDQHLITAVRECRHVVFESQGRGIMHHVHPHAVIASSRMPLHRTMHQLLLPVVVVVDSNVINNSVDDVPDLLSDSESDSDEPVE